MNDDLMTNGAAGDAALKESVTRALDPGGIPDEVQARLDRTYAAFGKIPQESPLRPARRRIRKSAVAVSVAAACALFAGVAYAASNLIQMQAGDAAFFARDANLPVYDSMEPGARSLSAQVGQTASVDGVEVTLDEVSCDRNVANLYLTLRKEGGFRLEELSLYEGSAEGEWARLQRLVPDLACTVTGRDGSATTVEARKLDAYLDGDAVRCLLRVTPEESMPEQVQLDIRAWTQGAQEPQPVFAVGLDLADVPAPLEVAAQDITFSTAQGEKVLRLERFTASELACVMVTDPQEETWTDGTGADVQGTRQGALDPALIKVTDDVGNVLLPVDAGDGAGHGFGELRVTEFAGLSHEAHAVTFTPVLMDADAAEADRQARAEAIQRGEAVDDGRMDVDVSQPGARIPVTGLGGYEVTGWDVQGSTVSIRMKPYGWVMPESVPELIPAVDVSMLTETWTDPESGEERSGAHGAIRYVKQDFATGEAVQMDSYYRASEEELRSVTDYIAFVSPAQWYAEDADAAQTLPLG